MIDHDFSTEETDLAYLSPPSHAYGAKPFQSIDLERHEESARIWATVMSLRSTVSRQVMEDE